jgi:cbb3-type cytochrome oxidase maturation protein
MDILYLLIPLSLVLVFAIAVFFWWSLRTNQYEDLDGPGYRILMDDDRGDAPALAETGRKVVPSPRGNDPATADSKDI